MTENPSPLFYWSFFSVFCLVYTVGYTAIFQNWNPKHRPEASSCLISLLHGTPAAIMAVTAITDSSTFLSSNSFFQSIVLDYSIAYFTVDLLHYLLFYPQDYLFMAHHVATLFVFITCRHVAFHGAFSLLVLLLLAEVTSFFQNIWTLAKMKREESAMATKLYDFISPSFFSLYTVMRGFLGPVFFYKMSRFYLGGEAIGVISWWVSFSWICVVGAAISVSILWIVNQWAEFFRERMIREKEKSC